MPMILRHYPRNSSKESTQRRQPCPRDSSRIRWGCVDRFGAVARPLCGVAFAVVSLYERFSHEPGENSARERKDNSAEEQRPADRGQELPTAPAITAQMQALQGRPAVRIAEEPIAHVILPKVNHGHGRQDYVVERPGEHGR